VPQWRIVDSVALESVPGGTVVEVRAPSFVWGMVRKIVGALREVESGRLSLSRLEAAIRGEDRLTLPLAEPDGLVLWSVEFPDVRWEAVWQGPNRHQVAFAARSREVIWRRGSVMAALFGNASGAPWPLSWPRRGRTGSAAEGSNPVDRAVNLPSALG
jgi:hypothetical protein